MNTAISIQNVSKRYQLSASARYVALRDVLTESFKGFFRSKKEQASSFWALENINLEIKEGERLGIIGHNGAGKSTLLKIISRITPPTSGRIILNGRVASLLEVGTGFHPELTGRENIYLNGSILGLKKKEIDTKLDEIVDFSGVKKFIDTPLKHYSSGMQMRLAFSVAAHLEAEILLIDEVLAVGDIEFQKKCMGKMEEVSKTMGKSIVFVSHNIGFIQNLCTSTVLLEKGKIKEQGSTERVINAYLQQNKTNFLDKPVIGNKSVEFIEFKISNNNIDTQHLLLGYPATFTLSFRALTNLKNIEVAFNIKNLQNELITHITSFDKKILLSAGKGEVINAQIQLHQINFTPSIYKIDVFILNNGALCWGCHDFEELTVINSDKALRPSGFPAHVKIFTETSWKIKQL